MGFGGGGERIISHSKLTMQMSAYQLLAWEERSRDTQD